jgi:hypothetical protein
MILIFPSFIQALKKLIYATGWTHVTHLPNKMPQDHFSASKTSFRHYICYLWNQFRLLFVQIHPSAQFFFILSYRVSPLSEYEYTVRPNTSLSTSFMPVTQCFFRKKQILDCLLDAKVQSQTFQAAMYTTRLRFIACACACAITMLRFFKNILENLIRIVSSRFLLISDIGFSNSPPPHRSRDNAGGIGAGITQSV